MPNNLNANHDGVHMGEKELTVQQVRQFLNDPSMEVTDKQLNDLLEAELQKPEDQIDLQLVDEILAALNPREVSEEEISASWKRLNQKIQAIQSEQKDNEAVTESTKASRKPIFRILRNFGLVAAAVVLLFFVSLGSARAMKWTFLLKFLNPIAQTFGIKLDDQITDIPSMEEYTAILDDQEKQQFSTEDEIPIKYNGYQIKLNNIPERFEFVEGSFYPTELMKSFDFLYQSRVEWLSYNVNIFETEQIGLEYQFETTMEVQEVRHIGMIELTFYHNGDDDTQSVSWVDRNAHYSLYGHITLEELTEIIQGVK